MFLRMRPPLVALWLTVAFLASPVRASSEGSGRITLLGGWRLTGNNYFAANAERAGTPLTNASPGGPFVMGSFGYAVLNSVEVSVEVFGGGEKLHLAGKPTLTSLSYGGMVGPRFCPELGHGIELSLGLSTGVVLVNESGFGLTTANEQSVQGWMGEAGLGWRAGPDLTLSVEYRHLFARGIVPGYGGISGGGEWLAFGVTFWVNPEPSSTSLHF